MKQGQFFEGHLTLDDILEPAAGMVRPIYLSMLAIHPVFEGDADILALLYESFVEAGDKFEAEGVKITDIYSNASTKKGQTLFVGQWGASLREKLLRRAAIFGRRNQARELPAPAAA